MINNNFSNFTSISPSAMSLLETRSFTTIPFAKEALDIISQLNSGIDHSVVQLPKEIVQRIMHFERRYLSIDQGLNEIGYNKILEFSSGFSFRGLNFCKNPDIFYIDTDLPNIIETKKDLVSKLTKKYCDYQAQNLIIQSMNALSEEEFFDSVSLFGSGPISVVNEGLLMYLNEKQKEKLCYIIHEVLSKYGGYWITADIYRQGEIEGRNIDRFYKQSGKEFLEKHNVEKNKFPTFEEAESFFLKQGLKIHKKIEIENEKLSSFNLLTKNFPSSSIKSQNEYKVRETWILKPI